MTKILTFFFLVLVICMTSACSTDDVAKKEAEGLLNAFVQFDFQGMNDVLGDGNSQYFKYDNAEELKEDQLNAMIEMVEEDYPAQIESITPILSEMYDIALEEVKAVRAYKHTGTETDDEDYDTYYCSFTLTTEREGFITDVILSSFYEGIEGTTISVNSDFKDISDSVISVLNDSLQDIETREEEIVITVYVNDMSYLAGSGMIGSFQEEWESISEYLK